MPFYPGGGGGGSGVGDVTADPAITNWDAATDGMFLASNGDATATFEDLPSKGTGATDGHVWTADGANGAGWEAPSVGGMLTPDGLTSLSLADHFNVKAFKASGSPNDFHCTTSTAGTTTVTTKDSAGAARTHDFAVGQGVCIHGAGAACAISAPVLTFGGVSVSYGTAAGTAYTFTVNAGTDVVTLSAAAPVSTGDPVRVSSSTTLPAGLAAATTYYWRETTSTTGTLYDTSAHAIAGGATGLIDITDAGTGTHTMVGYTEYRYTTRAGDGYGGFTAATAEISVFNWVFDGGNANYNQLRLHVPSLARSMAIYGNGTSGRRLRAHLEAKSIRSDNANATTRLWAFSGPVEVPTSTTKLRVTVATGHGLVANDVAYLNFLSSGDTAFSGQYLIESVTATTLTFVAGTWNAGMASATGFVEGSFIEWRDYGTALIRQATSGLPDVENPPMVWTAARAYVRGDMIVDGSGRIWRNYNTFLDREAGSVEPTWTAAANARIADNDCLWEREVAFVPTNDTDGAQRQMLLTTVATVPTASTFTTTNAAGADVSSNALVCQHNDALALIATRAAITTMGRGGTMYFPAGRYNCILPDYTNASYWTSMLTDAQPRYVFLRLDNEDTKILPYSVSVKCDPAAHIRCLMSAGNLRADVISGSQLTIPDKHFIGHGAHRGVLSDGLWTWDIFSGGLTEHYSTSSNSGGSNFCLMIASSIANSRRPWDLRWENMKIHWPNIVSSSGNTMNDGTDRMKWRILGCHIRVGAGDGDAFNIPKGEFEFGGGEMVLERRLGSHGFYIQGGDDEMNFHDFVMRFYGVNGTNAFSNRAAAGDQPLRGLRIHNVHFDRVTGPIRLVDASTSNRNIGAVLSNLTGRPHVVLAEIRDISITNSDLGNVTFIDDLDGVKINNCSIGNLDIRPTTRGDNLQLSQVKVRGLFLMANIYSMQCDNLTMENPYGELLNLRSAVYEWVQIGATQEYYCRLRANGGNPGLSLPSIVLLRDKYASATAGTIGALAAGGWAYGDPASLGYSTLVVHMGDSAAPNPDNWPYGSVKTAGAASTEAGMRFVGYVGRTIIDHLQLTHSWPLTAPRLMSGSGASFGEVTINNFVIETTAMPATGTSQLIQLSGTALARCDHLKFSNGVMRMSGAQSAGTVSREPFEINLARGGQLTLENVDLPSYGSGPDLLGCVGNVNVINCKIQRNVITVTALNSGDTWIEDSSSPNIFDTDGQPVLLKAGPGSSALPTTTPQVVVGTIYWYRNADSKLYTSQSNASTGTSPITVDADGSVEMTVLDASRLAIQPTYEYLGDADFPDAFGEVRGNRFRGSPEVTYAQITSDQNNYALRPIFDIHRLSTDASRTITGFLAPAAGTRTRRVIIRNVGAQDIVYAHASGSSGALNRFNLPGATSYTQATMTTAVFDYDVLLGAWVLAGNST